MTEINSSIVPTFQRSFPSSPLSSASSSPLSATSTHSRRHKSCNEALQFESEITPLICLTSTDALQSLNQNSHDVVQRRNSNTIEYRRVSKERVSWKKSLSELSEKLGEICGSGSNISVDGSPKSVSSFSSHSLSSSPMTKNKLYEKVNDLKLKDFPVDALSPPEQPHTANNTLRKPKMKRAESLFASVSPHKSIMVRHTETNQLLQKQLFQITKKMSGDEGNQSFSDAVDSCTNIENYHASSLQVQQLSLHKDTLLPTFEDFKVEMVNTTKLLIRRSSSPDNILLQVSLDMAVNRNCLCLMDRKNFLFLHNYPSSVVSLDYGTGTKFYIPVVVENPTRDGGYAFSISIPAEFKSEDILVKTVDNLLTVSCIHRRTSMGRMDRRSIHSTAPSPCHTTMDVSFLLPLSLDSRSVSASLTNHNQLIITSLGKLPQRIVDCVHEECV